MHLDVRLPVGLLFGSLGLLLTVYGLVSDREIYRVSLGINVNFAWGLILLMFGLSMLFFARRKRPDQFNSAANARQQS